MTTTAAKPKAKATPAKATPVKAAAPRKRAPAARKVVTETADAYLAAPAPTGRVAGGRRPEAGWYPDPDDNELRRYWDGDAWLGAGLPASMVEPEDPTQPEPAPTPPPTNPTVVFRDRTMSVRGLTVEQLTVWRRVGTEFEKALAEETPDTETDDQAKARRDKWARLLDRGTKVVMSVLIDRHDQDWVEDEMLEGRLTLSDAAQLVTLTVDAFTAAAEAQATTDAPAPKARRRR